MWGGVNKNKWRFYIKLCIISILGTLTHYYFLIYLFFSCCIWGIHLLVRHRIKEILIFIGSMLLAASISVAIFPYMLSHIFTGYRGTDSVSNLVHSPWLDNIKFFSSTLDVISGGIGLSIVCAVALLVIYRVSSDKFEMKNSESWVFIVLLPSCLYFLPVHHCINF